VTSLDPSQARKSLQDPGRFINADATLRPALDGGVAYLPGNSFFVHPGTGRNTMRLSFANPAHGRIEQGIERLARAVGAA
jgi:DNA-binding transcriptional MocR family regulator